MVAHPRPHKRQDNSNPLSLAPVSGIDVTQFTTVNAAPAAIATDALHTDGSAVVSDINAPPLAPTLSRPPIITTTTPPAAVPTTTSPNDVDAPDSTPSAIGATSTKPIALSTVIGSCVGAFIGAAALILLGLWFYRRYSQSLNKRRPRGPQTRNAAANESRRRSRLEPWNKLEDGNDGEDKWEGMYQTKEAKEPDQVAPMEKLTMFKKTPSVRTAYTHRSTDVAAFDFPSSYADFDPKLAETLTSSQTNLAQKPTFVGPAATASWATDNSVNKSMVSVNTAAASLSRDIAIPTPPPTASQLHRWESAEVLQVAEPQTAEIHNADLVSAGQMSSSSQNPFFDTKDDDAYARGRSPAMPDYKSPKAKGKERMRYSDEADPFDDLNAQLPKPSFVQHAATSSTSSTESKEKALQSLMAALELPEDEVRNRLRIASMQPSVISRFSSVVGDEDDEDAVAKSFPLPPSESRLGMQSQK